MCQVLDEAPAEAMAKPASLPELRTRLEADYARGYFVTGALDAGLYAADCIGLRPDGKRALSIPAAGRCHRAFGVVLSALHGEERCHRC